MAEHLIQGIRDDLIKRPDLRGRRVRVVVLDEETPHQPTTNPSGDATDNLWIRRLHAWANSHHLLSHRIDDGRDAIYSGTLNEPG